MNAFKYKLSHTQAVILYNYLLSLKTEPTAEQLLAAGVVIEFAHKLFKRLMPQFKGAKVFTIKYPDALAIYILYLKQPGKLNAMQLTVIPGIIQDVDSKIIKASQPLYRNEKV